MIFKNETTDQVRVVVRRHISNDEAEKTYVLYPDQQCEIISGTYVPVDRGYRHFEEGEREAVEAAAAEARGVDMLNAAEARAQIPAQVDTSQMQVVETAPPVVATGGNGAGQDVGGPATADGNPALSNLETPPDFTGLGLGSDLPPATNPSFLNQSQSAGIPIPGSENLPTGAQLTSAEMNLATGVVTEIGASAAPAVPENPPVPPETLSDTQLGEVPTTEGEAMGKPVETSNMFSQPFSGEPAPSTVADQIAPPDAGDPSVEAVEPPPVDNDHVAEGAEQFAGATPSDFARLDDDGAPAVIPEQSNDQLAAAGL